MTMTMMTMQALLATTYFLGATEDMSLTTPGAILMTVSIALVLGLAAFCLIRILRLKKPSEHHHAPLEIDTKDFD